jgi:hypothetical protein
MHRSILLFVSCLVPVALAAPACSMANGSVEGGDSLLQSAVSDADVDASSATWSALYSAYFGASGAASCSGVTADGGTQGVCHNTSTETGAQASSFVCGSSATTCWQGMTAAGSVVPSGGSSNASETILYSALRKQGGGGLMPCNANIMTLSDGGTSVTCSGSAGSAYTFTADDLARISAWVQAGAQND